MATMEDVKKMNQFVEFIEYKNQIAQIINEYERSKMEHMTKQEFFDNWASRKLNEEM